MLFILRINVKATDKHKAVGEKEGSDRCVLRLRCQLSFSKKTSPPSKTVSEKCQINLGCRIRNRANSLTEQGKIRFLPIKKSGSKVSPFKPRPRIFLPVTDRNLCNCATGQRDSEPYFWNAVILTSGKEASKIDSHGARLETLPCRRTE